MHNQQTLAFLTTEIIIYYQSLIMNPTITQELREYIALNMGLLASMLNTSFLIKNEDKNTQLKFFELFNETVEENILTCKKIQNY